MRRKGGEKRITWRKPPNNPNRYPQIRSAPLAAVVAGKWYITTGLPGP